MINTRLFSINPLALQPNQPIPQKTYLASPQAEADYPPLSVAKAPPALSRSRRDLQNDPAQGTPFKKSVRQFAKALVEQGDRELAISVGNALVRRQSFPDESDLNEMDKVSVPPYSTFGQALSRLADAVESEPFKSFAQKFSLDVSELYFEDDGALTAGYKNSKGHYKQFLQDEKEWAAASANVVAAAKQLMGRNQTVVSFSGRDHAHRNDVSNFYGFTEPATTDSNALLSAAGQLLRDENFKSLSSSDPLDAPIKQKQSDARQHIADLPLPALREILNKFAPSTAQQKVQRADQELAQLAARGMMKLIPETDQYDPSVTLQNIPEYSTFNLVRKNLLKALTSSVFTTFAKENELDPTSVSINPVSGKLTGTVKGVSTTFNLNDVSGWSDTWAEIKEAVLQMAAGSDDDVTYPTDNTAPLSQVMAFYDEPYPHQEDARKKGWEQRQLANTLRRIAEMIDNDGFKALTAPLPDDPASVAVQQRQRDRVRQLEGTTLSPSPMETLAATVKANLPAQATNEDSSEDLWAIAESDLAKTVHKAMLELKTDPGQVASKIIQPIPDNSLLGQWQAYLNKALKGRGFNEWAREQHVDLTSLRYDPAGNALIAKVKGIDQRFTATDFAQKYPKHFDVLTPVLSAAQVFAKPGQSISLSHVETSGVPYQWVANFYSLNDDPNSAAFAQQTALIGSTQQFPTHPNNPKRIVTWLDRQKTALGDSNDRYALIHELKNWTVDTGLKRFVVDPDSSHQPKSVTTVAAFISNNGWYPIKSKTDSDNLLAALQTQVPTAPLLGNRWGFLSTQLPLSTAQRDTLVKEVKNKIGADETLLNYLSSKIADLDTNPQLALEQLLNSDDALELATHLQTQMKGAITPTSLKQWLLTALVLELDPNVGKPRNHVAGFDFMHVANWGLSTDDLRIRFSKHLIDNKKLPTNLALAASHLLVVGAAPHLLVRDVPSRVTLGSTEWVSFATAVNRIELMAPGAAAHMTYEQVMAFHTIAPISAAEDHLQAIAKANPLIDWAYINGQLFRNPKDEYTYEQLTSAEEALKTQIQTTSKARASLSTFAPKTRRQMALEELKRKWGTAIDYENRFLTEKLGPGGIFSGIRASIVEIYEAGRLGESWRSEKPEVDFERLRAQSSDLPDINKQFNAAIEQTFTEGRNASIVVIKDMLSKLDADARNRLAYGNLQYFKIRENDKSVGLLIRTTDSTSKVRDFVVMPGLGKIEEVLGLPTSLVNSAHESTTSSTLRTVMEAAKKFLNQHYTSPQPSEPKFVGITPMVLEDGELINEGIATFGDLNENTAPGYDSEELELIAKIAVDSHFLRKDDFIKRYRHAYSNSVEEGKEPVDYFKSAIRLLPGGSSVLDIYHGKYEEAGKDAAIDLVIYLLLYGVGKLFTLAKTGASWATLSASTKFIDKLGTTEATDSIRNVTNSSTSTLINSTSRLQGERYISTTNPKYMPLSNETDGILILTQTNERVRISAIRENNNWYLNDPETGAIGPALDHFVSDTSSIIEQTTLADGTKALEIDTPLAEGAFTVPRTNGFDLMNGGKVYRYDYRNPDLLTELGSADHFNSLEDFEALCSTPSIAAGRTKRNVNEVCFTKVINDLPTVDAQKLQALEHVRLFPSEPKISGGDRLSIFKGRHYRLVEQGTGLRLEPMRESKPISYKQEITGSVQFNPAFGFHDMNPYRRLLQESRVVKIGSISESCNDSRELRGIIVADPQGSAEKHLVIEADTGEFYHAKLGVPETREVTFKKCTNTEKQLMNGYLDVLRTLKKPSTHYPTQLINDGKIASIDDLKTWKMLAPKKNTRETPLFYTVRQKLQSKINDIAITDTPTTNENGETKYIYDHNHAAVRQRREQLRKELEMDNYEAVRSEAFQTRLAQRVSTDRDANGRIFGQCAEMAAYAADMIKAPAKSAGYRTYLVQIPSSNHTIVLLSKNEYRAGARIDWAQEFASDSITVDLWQGTLSKDRLNAAKDLMDFAHKHKYTGHKPPATIQVEMRVP
ncbi:hypothetical protein ACW9IB_10585 [Pseudomonas sp. SDO524_S393]